VLTGTPIENSIKDLISLLNLANPGLIDNRSGLVSSDPNQYKAVIRAAKPFILRRSKNDVLKDLPPKIEQIFYCEMTPAQMKSYQELKEFYRNSLVKNAPQQNGGQRKIQILEALLRLRQTALHPQLINEHYEDDSGKFDALIEMLENVYAEGHKALVFSQFTSALKILRKKIEALGMECCYLDGQTKDRAEVVKTFQTDESKKIFLMSLKAGGVGLNLTEASYVFILDPWWNPAAEAQAIDRAHRIGQTKTVTSYKLISKDSIEEKILALQKNKKLLADELFSQESSFVANLTEDDLDYLLS
jgi:SNF2 family DNA or RNA helicase